MLKVIPEKSSLEIGAPFILNLSFTNTGDEPLYFRYSGVDFGPKSLNITLTKSECSYSIQTLHIDRTISDLRFDFVPLSPKDSFVTTVAFNATGGFTLPTIRIPSEGTYDLSLTFASEGPLIEGGFWPIWRGETKSQPVQITFEPASQNEVRKRFDELHYCLKSKPCEKIDAIFFFQIVRLHPADELVDLLHKILIRNPDNASSSFLAEAIANQGRKTDSVIFDELAENPDVGLTMRTFYEKMAKSLKEFSLCN